MRINYPELPQVGTSAVDRDLAVAVQCVVDGEVVEVECLRDAHLLGRHGEPPSFGAQAALHPRTQRALTERWKAVGIARVEPFDDDPAAFVQNRKCWRPSHQIRHWTGNVAGMAVDLDEDGQADTTGGFGGEARRHGGRFGPNPTCVRRAAPRAL